MRNEKSPKPFAKLRAVKRKKGGRQVFQATCLPFFAVVRLYGSSDPYAKQKQLFHIYEYTCPNRNIPTAPPDTFGGFFGPYLFYIFRICLSRIKEMGSAFWRKEPNSRTCKKLIAAARRCEGVCSPAGERKVAFCESGGAKRTLLRRVYGLYKGFFLWSSRKK